MPDVVLTLGGVDFELFEVPETINFGGDQRLNVHELIGGVRVIDTMGRSDDPITWSGRFRGSSAIGRARQVDALRIGGQQQTLTWDSFSYSVVVKAFKGNYERAGIEVPYTLTLVVVQDNSTPVVGAADDDSDDAIDSDLSEATGLGDDIGDSTLSGQLASISTAVSNLVGSVVKAVPSQLLSVLTPVQAAQAQITALAAGLNAQIDDSADFGGVTAGDDPEAIISAFSTTATAAQAMPNVYAAGSLLGRIATNLGAVGVSGRQVTQAGGSLYELATKAYGDVSGWTDIAEANGLVDPVLTGVNTLRIPPTESGSGGVLVA